MTERHRSRRLAAEPSPLREPTRANDLWTIDYKGQFRTGDGVLSYPLTVVDAYSRYLLSCAAHSGTSYPEARSSLERLFLERGLPPPENPLRQRFTASPMTGATTSSSSSRLVRAITQIGSYSYVLYVLISPPSVAKVWTLLPSNEGKTRAKVRRTRLPPRNTADSW